MKVSTTPSQEQGTARRAFSAMALAYFLGVFNDNFFKQAAMLMAIAAGMSALQGTATILFSLPFVLFSAWAGYCADRFPKSQVVVGSKILELVAMLIGAVGILTVNWPCILAMVFLMGLQSTLFGPALNGALPEVFSAEKVPAANAALKFASTSAILVGIASAGIVLDQNAGTGTVPFGRILVVAISIAAAVLGVAAAFACRKSPQPSTLPECFPWAGPIDNMKDLIRIRRNKDLFKALLGSALFYTISTVTVLVLNTLGLKTLHLSQTMTSLLPVALMIGVCGGAIVGARVAARRGWNAALPLACTGFGCALAASGGATFLPAFAVPALFVTLAATGFFGGLFLIPIVSFLQTHPAPHEKGRVLGTNNFLDFCGIIAAGQIYVAAERLLSPALTLVLLGAVSALCAALLFGKSKPGARILAAILRRLLGLRYGIQVRGLQKIPTETKSSIGRLFLPNHPALIDPLIVLSVLTSRFRVRPLVAADQLGNPVVRFAVWALDGIVVPDLQSEGLQAHARATAAIDAVIESLRHGDNVLLYPAGRIYRSRHENLAGKSGVRRILDALPGTPITLIRTTGLWGSRFSRATGTAPSFVHIAWRALVCLTANALLFGPRRPVLVECVDGAEVPRNADARALQKWLEDFYNAKSQPNTFVPDFWWQGRRLHGRPEPAETDAQSNEDTSDIPEQIRTEVYGKIQELTGIREILPQQRLAADLGIDSLTIVALLAWMEERFDTTTDSANPPATVAALLNLATGPSRSAAPEPEFQWRRCSERPLTFPGGSSVGHAFLAQARRRPQDIIMVDDVSGARTYRDLVLGVLLLRRRVSRFPEARIGIMLPASVGAAVAYFSVLFSGKTPVMLNWTVGAGVLTESAVQTGVRHILTSQALLDRLQAQGFPRRLAACDWVTLESLTNSFSLFEKLRSLVQSRTSWRSLRTHQPATHAAILFTSGSEARPKAVPLTHENLLTNISDSLSVLPVSSTDVMLAMLPPFHSFGLNANLILPLLAGLRTVCHANPTEGARLARKAERFQVSLMLGTPTFLKGLLQNTHGEQLKRLRLVLCGAEKCPESLARQLQELAPQAMLCEGYGITECSPVVSLNPPRNFRPGSIGRPLPSVTIKIVHPETGDELPHGGTGRLLVRGPSVFSGYLDPATPSPFVEIEGQRWYDTGDLVAQLPSGHLVFAGRLKRFVKVAGEMVSLPAIEAALAALVPEEASASLAVIPDQNDGVVLFTTRDFSLDEVNRAILADGLSGLHRIRRIVQVEEIPLLGSGKTDYRTLGEKLAS